MDKEAVEMRYLLGKLSDAEAAHLEESYFTDDDVFDEIETAEDELVDAYARGSLSAEDRKRFEQKLSKSQRLAERVEFAKLFSKTLSTKVVSPDPIKAGWWERLFDVSFISNPVIGAPIAAVLFLVVFGMPAASVWMRVRDERRLNAERAAIEQQKQELDRQRAAQEAKTNQLATDLENSKAEKNRLEEQLRAKEQLATTTKQPTLLSVVTVIPFITRDTTELKVLKVPATPSIIQLRLVLEKNNYTSYRAIIKTSVNPNVVTKEGLKPRRSGIIFRFSSEGLSSGVYHVSVSGLTPSGTYDPVSDYQVRVLKK